MAGTVENAPTNSPGQVDRPHPRPARALAGVWRLTYPGFLTTGSVVGTIGLVLALGLLSFAAIRRGDAEGFATWTVNFLLSFLLPVFSFLSGAGAVRDEMKANAVDYVLTRPIRRPLLIACRFITGFVCIQVPFLLALVTVIAVAVLREIPGAAFALPRLFAAQLVGSLAFLALGFVCAAWTSRYLIVGLLYGAAIEAGLGNTPTQLNRFSLLRHLKDFLGAGTGDFSSAISSHGSAAGSVLVLVLVSVVFVAAAAWIFSVREHAGAAPKQD